MPIVVKEVIVRTTVERKSLEWSHSLDEQLIEHVKRKVLAELPDKEEVVKARKYKKDR